MKKRKETPEVTDVLKEYAVNVYLFVMLLIFPLFFRNNYIDILRAKKALYLCTAACFLLLMLLLEGIGVIEKHRSAKAQEVYQRKSMFPLFLCISMTAWLIGVAGSGNPSDAFWGETGRYLGTVVFLLGSITLLLVAKYVRWNQMLTWSFLLGATLVFLQIVLNEWGIDVLHMNANLREDMQGYFISTMGSLNFNSSYLCMVIPVGMVMFVMCRERTSAIVYGSFLFLGFLAAVFCRSDGVFLGIAAAFLVLLWYVLQHKEKSGRLEELLLICILALGMTSLLYHVFGKNAYPLDGVATLLVDVRGLAAELVLLLIVYLCFHKLKEKKKKEEGIFTFRVVVLTGMLLLGALFVAANTARTVPAWLQPFVIDDNWGNHRGYIWRRAWRIFSELSVREKLFGCGTNCFSYVVREAYGEEMRMLFQAEFVDAHSEYLQMLLTTGIVGVVGYFGMIGYTLIKSIKVCRADENALFAVACIWAFLAQGIVNNPQMTTVPLLFVGLGIFLGVLRKKAVYME